MDWGIIFENLKERGLSGLSYVVSDDHRGLVKAIGRHFQGVLWHRCQVHFVCIFMSKLGAKDSQEYLYKLQDIFAAPDLQESHSRKDHLVEDLQNIKPQIASWIDDEIETCFVVYYLPEGHHRRLRSTNMLKRFNQEMKRRSRVIRIFPNEASCLRFLGSLFMEQSEEWETGRIYLNIKSDLKEKSCQGRIWQKTLNLAEA